MLILTNPELMSAMRNSYALQQILSKKEIDILIEKVFNLAQDAQKKLLEKFNQEKKEIEINKNIYKLKENRKNLKSLENLENFKKYKSEIKKIITEFKKQEETDLKKNNIQNIKNIDKILEKL